MGKCYEADFSENSEGMNGVHYLGSNSATNLLAQLDASIPEKKTDLNL